MLIREAGARVMSMLADGGVTPAAVTAADVFTVVEVYRRFAAIPADDAAPVEEDGDGVLAQFGRYDFVVRTSSWLISRGSSSSLVAKLRRCGS